MVWSGWSGDFLLLPSPQYILLIADRVLVSFAQKYPRFEQVGTHIRFRRHSFLESFWPELLTFPDWRLALLALCCPGLDPYKIQAIEEDEEDCGELQLEEEESIPGLLRFLNFSRQENNPSGKWGWMQQEHHHLRCCFCRGSWKLGKTTSGILILECQPPAKRTRE